ncbi:aminoglycoside phosphotransferase family protein [Amycolatopsis sp. NPDC058986]|uniref:aminoglycoside phosphotransferase family protein n=1 Tax=unclassified Amycolatopsis TaxID=2618356 RepID=UPI00366DFA84
MDFPGGWDSAARLVDGRWVERRPRRPEVAARLRAEVRLMPWLAPRLPLPVPVPHVLSEAPLVVRHELVPGEPLERADADAGHRLGVFLRALHDAPSDEAIRRGVPSAEEAAKEHAAMIDRFRAEVVPMLPADHRPAAGALLDATRELSGDTLVHGDLGPEHVLAGENGLTGIIDFGDTHIGDAAIDLAWALYGTPRTFADAVATTYDATSEQRERALRWHQLGPWHEVTHGLDTADPDTVRDGLDGVVARLAER